LIDDIFNKILMVYFMAEVEIVGAIGVNSKYNG
jgi:hypothetical protein